MIGIEALFVFVLYVLLVYEIIEAIRGPRNDVKQDKSAHYIRYATTMVIFYLSVCFILNEYLYFWHRSMLPMVNFLAAKQVLFALC